MPACVSGSPETNVDTSENRHDFIDKLQRLKQQVLDGIGQEKSEEEPKSTDGQQIMIARTIFTSDTSNESTITVGNWTFECNGPTQLRIHNVEGEQVRCDLHDKDGFTLAVESSNISIQDEQGLSTEEERLALLEPSKFTSYF